MTQIHRHGPEVHSPASAASETVFAVSEVAIDPGTRVVSVSASGRLVGDAAARNLASALQQRASRSGIVLLDLSRSPMADRASLDVIIEAYHRLLAAGGILGLTGVGPRIARLLELMGLDKTLFIGHSTR